MRDYRTCNTKDLTFKLLKIIGSPFVNIDEVGKESPKTKKEISDLYSYAIKNKIGLLFLESLRSYEKLEKFGLESEYQKLKTRHYKQLHTAVRITRILDNLNVDYAIFKSIMPFPATPNDIDIIHFGSDEDFRKLIEVLPKFGYMMVESGADAEQRMFHDSELGGYIYPHPREKDEYDVDIYQKISASYLIYLDKKKLEKHITETSVLDSGVKTLKPEAEVVVFAIHSIIPEQLHTLLAFYTTLYHLKTMNSKNINKLITIAEENNVKFPVRVHFSLIAELHQACYGFVPEKVKNILEIVGNELSERRKLAENSFKMPHRCSWSVIIKTLLEKIREEEFRKSVIKQAISMTNPKLARWVIWNIIWRRRRETY